MSKRSDDILCSINELFVQVKRTRIVLTLTRKISKEMLWPSAFQINSVATRNLQDSSTARCRTAYETVDESVIY